MPRGAQLHVQVITAGDGLDDTHLPPSGTSSNGRRGARSACFERVAANEDMVKSIHELRPISNGAPTCPGPNALLTPDI